MTFGYTYFFFSSDKTNACFPLHCSKFIVSYIYIGPVFNWTGAYTENVGSYITAYADLDCQVFVLLVVQTWTQTCMWLYIVRVATFKSNLLVWILICI